ncbi:GH17382 [Drosophila grimshawi]|uniref:GH17382 n=2 Tax=Drosophila grimshawi TaxID=7222 RepID=B4JV13_DROGR|nr:GH17382 [Drosophila grimshawi]
MDKLFLSLLLLSCLYASSNGDASELPAGIQKCSINDENCLKDSMNYVIKNYAKTGIKELGLVQLDPLLLKKFSLPKKPNSPVSIDLTFRNASMIGFAEAQVKKASFLTSNLSRTMVFDFVVPKIILKGPYSINGQVLILPIVGKGNAEIVLKNCRSHFIVKLEAVSKGPGLTYVNVVDLRMDLEPSHVTYKLGGLFGGQKDLSENLHILINENWREIFNELKDDISVAMGLIFKLMLSKTMSMLPLEQLFSDGNVLNLS